MGLVHRHHSDLRVDGKIEKFRCQKALWRDVDDRISALAGISQRFIILPWRQGTV